MKPRKNYRTRPKKTGAKKRQKILAQKRRLVAAGHDAKHLDKLTVVDIRNLLKLAARKKAPAQGRKKVVKKAAKPKKTVAAKRPAKKKKTAASK